MAGTAGSEPAGAESAAALDKARGSFKELASLANQWNAASSLFEKRRAEVEVARRFVRRHAHLLPMNLSRRAIRPKLRLLSWTLYCSVHVVSADGCGEPAAAAFAGGVALSVLRRCRLRDSGEVDAWLGEAGAADAGPEDTHAGDLRDRGVHHSAEHADLSRQLLQDAGAPALILDSLLGSLYWAAGATPTSVRLVEETVQREWAARLRERSWVFPRTLLAAVALSQAVSEEWRSSSLVEALGSVWEWYAGQSSSFRATGPSMLWLAVALHEAGCTTVSSVGKAGALSPLAAVVSACHHHWSPKHLLSRLRGVREPPPVEHVAACAERLSRAALFPMCEERRPPATPEIGATDSPLPWESDGPSAALIMLPGVVRYMWTKGGVARADAQRAVECALRGAVAHRQPMLAAHLLGLLEEGAGEGVMQGVAADARGLVAAMHAERGEEPAALAAAKGEAGAVLEIVRVLHRAGKVGRALALAAAHGVDALSLQQGEGGVGADASRYALPGHVQTHWVDSAVTAAAAMRALSSAAVDGDGEAAAAHGGVTWVGVDAEWKPVLGKGRRAPPSPALLQVAAADAVLLLDLSAAAEDEALAADMRDLLATALGRGRPAIVGYALEGDFAVLSSAFPSLFSAFRGLPVLDLARAGALVGGAAVAEGGLAAVVEGVLGRILDKSCQVTNWEQRPLRRVQFEYAAADAYVLVDVVRALCEQLGAAAVRRLATRAVVGAGAAGPLIATPCAWHAAVLEGLEEGPHVPAEAPEPRSVPLSVSSLVPPRCRGSVEAVVGACGAVGAAGPRRWRLLGSEAVLDVGGGRRLRALLSGGARASGSAEEASAALRLPMSSLLKTVLMECIPSGGRASGPRLVAAVLLPCTLRVDSAALVEELRQRGEDVGVVRRLGAEHVRKLCGSLPGEVPCIGWRALGPPGQYRVLARFLDVTAASSGRVAGGAGHCGTFLEMSAPLSAQWLAQRFHVRRIGVQPAEAAAAGVHVPPVESLRLLAAVGQSTGPGMQEGQGRSGGGATRRFVLDGTVIRLAKWLRILGIDADVAADEQFRGLSGFAALCFQALEAGQRVLTKNKKFAATRQGRLAAALLEAPAAEGQVKELVRRFALHRALDLERIRGWHALVDEAVEDGGPRTTDPSNVFCGRCVKCNCASFDFLSREEVAGLIPERSRLVAMAFWQCKRCRQIFWPGSSYVRSLSSALRAVEAAIAAEAGAPGMGK